MITIPLGQCVFALDLANQYAETRFADGTTVPACPHDTDDYRETARQLGYGADTWAMCWQHEMFHTVLAIAAGLPYSPTLWAVAHGEQGSVDEEAAVLEFQREMMALAA